MVSRILKGEIKEDEEEEALVKTCKRNRVPTEKLMVSVAESSSPEDKKEPVVSLPQSLRLSPDVVSKFYSADYAKLTIDNWNAIEVRQVLSQCLITNNKDDGCRHFYCSIYDAGAQK
jgi:hypothetical protein